jgi:rsbT antagonist protein RsbS
MQSSVSIFFNEMDSGSENVQRVTFNQLQNCLVGTIQADLDARMLERFQSDLLSLLNETRTPWLVLDCSGVEVLDLADFEGLRRIIAMASLMGTRSVIAGLRPGVVSSLIQLDADTSGLDTALSLALALERVHRGRIGPGEEEERDGAPEADGEVGRDSWRDS